MHSSAHRCCAVHHWRDGTTFVAHDALGQRVCADDVFVLIYTVLVGLAGAFAVGILLNVLAAFINIGDAQGPNPIVLVVLVFYFLAPWPNIMFKRCGGGFDVDGSGGVWKDMGFFITGFLIVSGLALPVALRVATIISTGAMIMSIAGGVIIYGSVALYSHYFSAKSEF